MPPLDTKHQRDACGNRSPVVSECGQTWIAMSWLPSVQTNEE
jgi:hypothetical protein